MPFRKNRRLPADYPFPTVQKLSREVRAHWKGYERAVANTRSAERKLKAALMSAPQNDRLLGHDCSLVLCGSFARYEMLADSDYDWTLLVDGVVDNDHVKLERMIRRAILKNKLRSPSGGGPFGNLSYSHDLVHRIGGGADSNANLTRRILMILESRPFDLSRAHSSSVVWDNVLKNILERYFEEEVHFSPGKVPRFLLNDLVRYWRTIGVDYAAKHREEDGKKWAIRNAKLRFSRKLLLASGLAFCFSCQLTKISRKGRGCFIDSAKEFARTPALEYLARFVDKFVIQPKKRRIVAEKIFGSYNKWLLLMGKSGAKKALESLTPEGAVDSPLFKKVRKTGTEFAKGLELLFFNRDRTQVKDPIAKLSFEYAGF